MSEQTLTRAERLRSLKVIRRLFEEGRSGFVYPFRYLWLADEDEDEGATEIVEVSTIEVVSGGVEVLFSVPKRFLKRANKRNLVRRRAKEAYRLGKGEIVAAAGKRKVRIALVYSTKKIHEYRTINNAIERILGEISRNL
ncbi:MAG: ribonuclease P protein component [Rikenellaceae bacterium]|nr:ribonuclease P protein component [Rikenellaceae bacterium]MBP3682179.1 ribonuclease P protein component [Rikenellaceae bacterium]